MMMCNQKKRVFHGHMLKKWHIPSSTNYLSEEVLEDEEVPNWNDGSNGDVKIGEKLTEQQKTVRTEGTASRV